MDAYLICPETRKLLWLGKPVRSIDSNRQEFVSYFNRCFEVHNHDDTVLNRMLWRFLAEHAHKSLRVVFETEFNDAEYEPLAYSDLEEHFLNGWPPDLAKSLPWKSETEGNAG